MLSPAAAFRLLSPHNALQYRPIAPKFRASPIVIVAKVALWALAESKRSHFSPYAFSHTPQFLFVKSVFYCIRGNIVYNIYTI